MLPAHFSFNEMYKEYSKGVKEENPDFEPVSRTSFYNLFKKNYKDVNKLKRIVIFAKPAGTFIQIILQLRLKRILIVLKFSGRSTRESQMMLNSYTRSVILNKHAS